jgi:hypothetical protein
MRRGKSLDRKTPRRLMVVGAILFVGGYLLLQYNPTPARGVRGPYVPAGSALFLIGLVLTGIGVTMWLSQPPVKRKRRRVEEESDTELETADSGEDDDLIPCPYCRQPIYEESERCPYCEKYISVEDAPLVPKVWIAIGVTAALFVTILWIFLAL